MMDALDRLLDRSQGTARTVVPRLPGHFEPSALEVEQATPPDGGVLEADGVLEANVSRRPMAAPPPRAELFSASPDDEPDAEPSRDTREQRSAGRVDANPGRLEGTGPPAARASTAPNLPAAPMPSTASPQAQPPSEPASPPARPAAAMELPPPGLPSAAPPPPQQRRDQRAPQPSGEPASRPVRPAAALELPPGSPSAVPSPPQARRHQRAPQPPGEPASRPARPAAALEPPLAPPPAAPPPPQARRHQRTPQPSALPKLASAEVVPDPDQALLDAEQRIEVHIGRIEVRMHSPAPAQQRPQRPAPRRPSVSLGEYLDRRRKG